MKIYIINKSLENVNLNALLTNKTLQNTATKYIELYSKHDGKYIIDAKAKCLRIEPNFNQSIEVIKDYKTNNLLVDNTIEKVSEVVSQLPTEYIRLNVLEYCFFTGIKGKAQIKLIIKCLEESDGLKIIDYYLVSSETKIDFDNQFFTEDLDMFLSLF
jgi:hypothetical protein